MKWKNFVKKRAIGDYSREAYGRSMIRSRARWIEHGEKASSYFCHLDKSNFQSKRMVSLVRDDQTEITDTTMITEEIKAFYTNLYM